MLDHLCHESTHPILAAILRLNPQIFAEAPVALFTNLALSKLLWGHEGMHNLYLLSCTPAGCRILYDLLKSNTQLTKSIEMRDLLRPASYQETCCHQNISTLSNLSISTEGIKCLKYLFQTNPKLMEEIKIEDFVLRMSEANNNYLFNTSIFYWLCVDECGLEILTNIFKVNQNLARSIQLADLTAVCPQYEGVAAVSALSLLKSTKAGCAILDYLLEVNLQLQRDLHEYYAVEQTKQTSVARSSMTHLGSTPAQSNAAMENKRENGEEFKLFGSPLSKSVTIFTPEPLILKKQKNN